MSEKKEGTGGYVSVWSVRVRVCVLHSVCGKRRKKKYIPPEKGKNCHLEPLLSSSHLSGRNSKTSSPHRSGRRCIKYTENAIVVPLATTMGAVPSGPPPVGNVVSTAA